jgi:hypothetical protein
MCWLNIHNSSAEGLAWTCLLPIHCPMVGIACAKMGLDSSLVFFQTSLDFLVDVQIMSSGL